MSDSEADQWHNMMDNYLSNAPAREPRLRNVADPLSIKDQVESLKARVKQNFYDLADSYLEINILRQSMLDLATKWDEEGSKINHLHREPYTAHADALRALAQEDQ